MDFGFDLTFGFLDYFEERGHTIVPSSSLIPDDPSVLLTTAGMQQFKRYFTGELDPVKDFGSKNTVSVQKSFRTSDIDEVGDESHLTFFEMLGNFSFGGYFKKEAIEYAHEFITKEMGLEIDYVSVFDPEKVPKGDWRKDVPFDEKSYNIWKEKIGLPDEKIKREGVDNFWGPTGGEGPCGPTTEIYVKGLEIWNIVFNEFYCDKDKKLAPLKTPGVDTGMGLERLAMVSQGVPTIFETDLLKSIIDMLPESLSDREKRIVADHSRGIAFIISDGVRPSNKEADYILRKLIRRVVMFEKKHVKTGELFKKIVEQYGGFYKKLDNEVIQNVFIDEYVKFTRTLRRGLNELKKLEKINAKAAFDLYQSFGLPYEVIKDVGKERAKNLNREEFDKEFSRHQEISRAGAEKKFGGHGLLLDTGELKAGDEEELKKATRLHTVTHLLHQALRDVLGQSVRQMGSDVNAKRTRFDFSFDRKLTDEEVKKVEEIVNNKIKEDLPVNFKELPKEEAEKTGALHFFKEKYPDTVKVYYIGPNMEKAYSKEFCGGPHVTHTGEIGEFRIQKQESIGAGVRRIRAVLE